MAAVSIQRSISVLKSPVARYLFYDETCFFFSRTPGQNPPKKNHKFPRNLYNLTQTPGMHFEVKQL